MSTSYESGKVLAQVLTGLDPRQRIEAMYRYGEYTEEDRVRAHAIQDKLDKEFWERLYGDKKP